MWKVNDGRTDRQTDGRRTTHDHNSALEPFGSGALKIWYHVKGLVTRNTHLQYESPIASGLKVMAKFNFFKSRSNFKVKVTISKIMVPRERICHKEYTYEIWKLYLGWFGRYVECVNWLFNVTINDISVIYVTAHRCAGGLKKKLDLRSGSQHYRHFVGFFNLPVLAPTRGQPFYAVIVRNRPI